jgi:hypothetical protein
MVPGTASDLAKDKRTVTNLYKNEVACGNRSHDLTMDVTEQGVQQIGSGDSNVSFFPNCRVRNESRVLKYAWQRRPKR